MTDKNDVSRDMADKIAAEYRARQAAKNAPSPSSLPPGLSAEEAARIRAEETYRATLRAEQQQQHLQANRPNYWVGFFLDMLVVGVGHMVIGEVVWGVVWLVLAIAVNLSTSFLAWPFIALGVLFHYRSLYAKKYGT